MFHLKDGSKIETVPNASELLGGTLNIQDDDCPGILCPKRVDFVLMSLLQSQQIPLDIH
jgi:hypothetical protein